MTDVAEPTIPPVDEKEGPERTAPSPPPKPKRAPRGRGAASVKRAQTAAMLQKQLADAARAGCLGVLMLSPHGPQVLAHTEVVTAVDERAEKFGAAWAAVAAQDPRVALWLERLSSGGVWVAAGAQTLALAVLVSTLAGRPLLPPAAAALVMPELRPFIRQEPPPASENGARETPFGHAEES